MGLPRSSFSRTRRFVPGGVKYQLSVCRQYQAFPRVRRRLTVFAMMLASVFKYRP